MNIDGVFKASFVEEMNRLGIKDVHRIPRYYAAVKDLPLQALREITNDFLDSAKYTPLPKDFLQAANEWKKHFYLKNGYYFGHEPKSVVEAQVDCKFCFDTGVTKIKHHQPDGFQKLLRCDCEKGLNTPERLPHWNNELQSAFIREAIDPVWFNPQIDSEDKEIVVHSKIWRKVKDWRKTVKTSEEYWRDVGYGP